MPTNNHKRKLEFFNFRSVVKMIKNRTDPLEIVNFILRNNINLEKNFFGKSILYYALDAGYPLVSRILEIKEDFSNEYLTIRKAMKRNERDLIINIDGNQSL